MALFHAATITPTKAEVVADLVTSRPWGSDGEVETVGAFRFDDPAASVGIETHLASAGGHVFQVPLTYRDAPLPDDERVGDDDPFVCEMEHSALGTRYVHDGLGDARFLTMLAAVAMTGQGEALGMAQYDGRWFVAPADTRIEGGGWTSERVALDRFHRVDAVPSGGDIDDDHTAVFRNDRFELRVARRPVVAPRPPLGLVAHTPDGTLLLATVADLGS